MHIVGEVPTMMHRIVEVIRSRQRSPPANARPVLLGTREDIRYQERALITTSAFAERTPSGNGLSHDSMWT